MPLKEALMMSEKHGKRYTPRLKVQAVIEILSGTKAIGQIARSYGVHPVTLTDWKEERCRYPTVCRP